MRNDSFVVAAANRGNYADLLAAGVRVFDFSGGLLHAKFLTLDGEVTLIGSAYMDRQSFDLNCENDILLHEVNLTGEVRRLQDHYISKSTEVRAEKVAGWPVPRRLWENTIEMLGPLL